jgi:hypothetical protein
MHVEIDPIIGTAGEWAEGVRRGNLILEKMLGDFKDQTKARWTVEQGENKTPQLTLELALAQGTARAGFSSPVLADGREFWRQLNELWFDTLGDANRKRLPRMKQLLEEVLREEEKDVAEHAS